MRRDEKRGRGDEKKGRGDERERETRPESSDGSLSPPLYVETEEGLTPEEAITDEIPPPEDADLPPIDAYTDDEPLAEPNEDIEVETAIFDFVEAWNEERGSNIRLDQVPQSVRKNVLLRLGEVPDLERWRAVFRKLHEGWGGSQSFATLSWIVKDDGKLFEIEEGKFDESFEPIDQR